MRQKRGRHCPKECRPIVAFANGQLSSQHFGQAGGRLLLLIYPTQSPLRRAGTDRAELAVEGGALNVITQ